MKKLIIILYFFCCALIVHAQPLDNYIENNGAALMAKFAHLSNTYNSYSSSYTSYADYYLLDLYYTDVNFSGYRIHTRIKLGKGFGNFYFNSISVLSDNDDFRAFGALLLGIATIMEIARENNPAEYYKSISQMQNYLGLEPENWNGADWALFLINFDYGCRCLDD